MRVRMREAFGGEFALLGIGGGVPEVDLLPHDGVFGHREVSSVDVDVPTVEGRGGAPQ